MISFDVLRLDFMFKMWSIADVDLVIRAMEDFREQNSKKSVTYLKCDGFFVA